MIDKLVLCIAVIVIYWARAIRKRNIKQKIKVGQPPSIPILGHALHLTPDKLINSAEAFHSKYGGVVELYALAQRIYLISDLSLIKEILNKRPKLFRRVRSFDYGAKLLGLSSGLFNIHGASQWSRIRKLTSPSLAKHNIVANANNILKWSLVLKDRLVDASKDNDIVELKNHAFSFALHVLIDSMFGSAKLNPEMQEYFFTSQFIKDIFSNFNFMIESSTFPFPMWLWHLIPYYQNIENEAIAADGRLDRYSRQIVIERRSELASNPTVKKRNNMIDILLTQNPNVGEGGTSEVSDISVDEIVANVKTFFAGGSDTTSNAISWVVYFLSLNQDVQKEVREEVVVVFDRLQRQEQQQLSDEEMFNLFSAESLPLTNAVVKETLRLVSPAPMLFLQLESSTEAHTLSNGLVLQPDDQIFAGLDNVHWNSETFSRAKEFLPHRWLTTDKEQLQRLEEAFVGFGGGPRVCPGWGFAMMESVVAIATLVHFLEVELACESSEVKRVFAFAAQPNKVPVKLRERKVTPLASSYLL